MNSTQNLKLDGIAHRLFLDKFLGPLFFAQIDDLKEEIEKYDKKVVTSLNTSPKGPMKGLPVKKIRSKIDQLLFTCKICQETFPTFTSLTKHKREHSSEISSRPSSPLIPISTLRETTQLLYFVKILQWMSFLAKV